LADNSENIIEFTLIFNRFKKKLYNYVLNMTEDIMLAEDIIQDIFLKLYQNLDNIRSKENINFWLFTTARNEVYGYYRRKKIKTDQFNVDDVDEIEIESEENIEDELEKKEVKELIQTELNNLPVEQREVFILKEYSGLSYKVIASLMEINEELVKSRLYKVRKKLVKRISKHIK
jgi:RNA polymerase sigma-70 factor (ECF subfamily)